MITKTVYIQEIIKVGDPFSEDLPFTAVTGHPYMTQPSPLAIFNSQGSGVKARIKLMNLRPLSGANALTSVIAIQKITAFTGGIEDTAFKFDSVNDNLPSQVKSVYSPSSVTLVANSALRKTMTLCLQNKTRALARLCCSANGDTRSGMDAGEFVRLTGDTAVTGYILREGEGIALVYKANAPAHGFTVNIRIKNQSNGQCYRYDYVLEPRFMINEVPCLVFNGTDSGIVIEVEKIQIREIGTDEIVQADYSIIDGIMGEECSGSDGSFFMADSTDTLPSGILIKKNCVTARAGSKLGGLITIPAQRKLSLAEAPYGPGISGGLQVARRGVFTPDMLGPDIILNEGTGIGVFLRNAGSQLYYEFTAIVNIEIPETPSGSGATCFAF